MAMLALAEAAAVIRARVAGAIGLSSADLEVLEMLARRGPVTAGELGEHTGLASASVTGMIDRLETGRFVQRVRDPVDGRRVRVKVRPEAMRRVGEALRLAGLDLPELAEPFTTEQLETASAVLQEATIRLRARLEQSGMLSGRAPRSTRGAAR